MDREQGAGQKERFWKLDLKTVVLAAIFAYGAHASVNLAYADQISGVLDAHSHKAWRSDGSETRTYNLPPSIVANLKQKMLEDRLGALTILKPEQWKDIFSYQPSRPHEKQETEQALYMPLGR